MGFLDFLFGKKKAENTSAKINTTPTIKSQPQQVHSATQHKTEERPKANPNIPFSKPEFEKAIKTISTMSYLFRDSSTLRSTGDERNERMMSRLHSYAGILGYLYQFTYKLGDYSNLVDSTMKTHFALVTIAMSDVSNRNKSLKDLANNWSDVLQSVLYLQIDGTSEGNKMKALQTEIDFVTKVMEKLSGDKCRKPVNQMANGVRPETIHPSYDKYSKMVEEAAFNPFNITTKPSLQNNPPLPPEFLGVFRKELNELLCNPMARQMGVEQLFRGYVFNMVESYYNNAQYVPKSTVDAIIEMCYQAVINPSDTASIGSLEDIKYKIYYSFLHN